MSANFKAYLMLTLCAFFWSGNFIVGKFATLYEVPPLTLNFFRWLIVWIILIPFTFRDIFLNIKIIKEKFYSILLMSFTSISIFNSVVYYSLNFTQVSKWSIDDLYNSGINCFYFFYFQRLKK